MKEFLDEYTDVFTVGKSQGKVWVEFRHEDAELDMLFTKERALEVAAYLKQVADEL